MAGETTWWSALATLVAVLGLPLLLVDVPPLLDYPNHLARAVILAFGGQDPVLSQMARAHWGVVPDLGADLFLPGLLHLLPVYVAGRIAVALALLLPVAGAVAYSRAALGTRSWFVLGIGLVAYGQSFLLGFLNFRLGIGLALLLAAAWAQWRDVYPIRTLALAMAGAVALFFCHLMGLVFFAVLVGANEATAAFRSGRMSNWLTRAVMLLAVFAAPAVLYWLSPLEAVAGGPVYPAPAVKLRELMVPFTNYDWELDIATAVLVGGVVLAGLATRRLVAASGPALALCLLLIAWLAAPFGFKETSHLDERFVTMASLMIFACLRPVRLPRGVGSVAVIGFVALFALRMTVVAEAWWGHRADVAGLRAAAASVEPGSRVFVTSVSPEEAPAYWAAGPAGRRLSDGKRTDAHMPALLLIERRAWWPFLFDNPSQQPVVQIEPYRRLARRVSGMMPHRALDGAGINRVCGFDYVLLLEAGGERALDDFGDGRLGLVTADDFAALFRVYPQFLHCGKEGP